MAPTSRRRLRRKKMDDGTWQEASLSDTETTVTDNPTLTVEEAAKIQSILDGGMRTEVKRLDKKQTEYGQVYYTETVLLEEELPEQVNWWTKFALCLVRQISRSGSQQVVQKTSLQINSPHLKDLLNTAVESYPGISFATKDITIDKPYHVLFHYRNELEEAGKELEDGSEGAQHLDLLLDFIHDEFKDIIAEADNLLEQGIINYEYLWTLFCPGCTVFGPVFGQPQAFTLRSCSTSYSPPGLALQVEYVDFDGEDMGTRMTDRFVPAFSGSQAISDLSTFPIDRHPIADRLKQQLISRGRRWEQYAGMHFANYKGIAIEYDTGGISRYNVSGRVVVDTKTYYRLNADRVFSVTPFKVNVDKHSKRGQVQMYEDYQAATLDLLPEDRLDVDHLTDKQCLLANSIVRGFSFSEKRWLDFFIDKLSPVDWNPHCFDELVLPAAHKDLVKSLVSTHTQQHLGFDDIVKGKGKGLIFVLHGPPGVGKTLTAETVAEYCRRPLYMVSSGDLGTYSETLDERLSRILDMSSTWKAVLLIDEADVFLERRSLHDMQRNSLVSIFLRVLEYYEGILFLTSNRVETFDDAFKSRIHVPLKYNNLTADSRKAIWKNFLGKLDGEVRVGDDEYERLAQASLNGRQIKNVIRTAKSLAQFHGEGLDCEKLEQVIAIQMEFEQELDFVNGVNELGLANGC